MAGGSSGTSTTPSGVGPTPTSTRLALSQWQNRVGASNLPTCAPKARPSVSAHHRVPRVGAGTLPLRRAIRTRRRPSRALESQPTGRILTPRVRFPLSHPSSPSSQRLSPPRRSQVFWPGPSSCLALALREPSPDLPVSDGVCHGACPASALVATHRIAGRSAKEPGRGGLSKRRLRPVWRLETGSRPDLPQHPPWPTGETIPLLLRCPRVCTFTPGSRASALFLRSHKGTSGSLIRNRDPYPD